MNQVDGTDILLIGQKSADVFALDPVANGALLWKRKIGRGGLAGGVHWGMAVDTSTETLFVPIADTNVRDRYASDGNPGLFAFDAKSGDLKWFAPAPRTCAGREAELCSPGLSAPITAINGVVFAGALDGHLRAYESATGRIIWDFNTARQFITVSGEKAHGGAIEGAGPVIVGGHVLVNSGYLWGGNMPGNVLLNFALDSK